MMLDKLIKGLTRDSKWYTLVMEWLDNYVDNVPSVLPIDSDNWVTFDVEIDDTQKVGAVFLEILANCEEYTVYTTDRHVHYHITFETFDVFLMYRQI